MKSLFLAAAACALAGALVTSPADAQRRHAYAHRHYPARHVVVWHDRSDWRQGGYVSRYDYNRGAVVDYRVHRLRRPPAGYEWRRVDNNYVMVAIATGLIASIIASHN